MQFFRSLFCAAVFLTSNQVLAQSNFPELSEHAVVDPTAPLVTEANLVESERFWPYLVDLTADWKAPTRVLPKGSRGVLIRVGEGLLARIDFGRDGLHEVAVSSTDLVARANQVRLGELSKTAPNLTMAIGPRLIDTRSADPTALRLEEVREQRAFITIFADPASPYFSAMAKELAKVSIPHGVLVVLIVQGDASGPAAHKELLDAKLSAVTLSGPLAAPYTESLLPASTPPPAVLLQTAEGRLLYGRQWKPGAGFELSSALLRNFGHDEAPAPSQAKNP